MSEDFELISSTKNTSKKKTKKIPTGLTVSVNILLSVILIFGILFSVGFGLVSKQGVLAEEPEKAKQEMADVKTSDHKDVTYFLVTGTDEDAVLTDIMMVVCFDHKQGKVNILQIPRDTFIGTDIPTGKINAVYGSAKDKESRINVLMKRINTHLGLPIDHYITVSIPAFRTVVDKLGGIDVYIPHNIYNAYDSKAKAYNFYGGEINHMDGGAAEAFVRFRRSYAMGDLGRVEAQRNFYSAFLKKVMEMSTTQMVNIATACYSDFKTSMAIGTLLGYAQELQKLKTDDIKFYSIPGQSGYYAPKGESLSFFSIHKSEYIDLINEHFLPYEEYYYIEDDIEIWELHKTYHDSYLENEGTTINDYIEPEDEE